MDYSCFPLVINTWRLLPTIRLFHFRYLDHPQGQFFWHVHRHGSVTMQEWQGMVGLLNVGDATTAGSPENDLIKNDVVAREEDLVLWEWVIATSKRIGPSKTTNTFFEGNFIPLDDGGK